MSVFRLLPHVVCLLLLAPAFGSPVLPLYDYPMWHDDFQELATSPNAQTWSRVMDRFASHGRFVPGYVAFQACFLRLNGLPQVGYWLLVNTAAQASAALLYGLLLRLTHSPALSCVGCLAFLLQPSTVSTYFSTIHAEVVQVPFIIAYLGAAHACVDGTRSTLRLAMAVCAFLGALLCKETGGLLLASTALWFGCAKVCRCSTAGRMGTLLLFVLGAACAWWLWRSHSLQAVVGGYPKRLLAPGVGAYCRTLLIWATESAFCVPLLMVALPSLALRCSRGFARVLRGATRGGAELPVDLLFAIPFFVWLLGQACFDQLAIRYTVPLNALALVAAFAWLGRSSAARPARTLGLVLVAAGLLNGGAAALTARQIECSALEVQRGMVECVSPLPPGSVVYVDGPAPLDDRAYAASIAWSVRRAGRGHDLSFEGFDPTKEISADRGYCLVTTSDATSYLSDSHPGGKALRFAAGAREPVQEMSQRFLGWQLRGVDLLVLGKALLAGNHRRVINPIGLTQYEVEFRLYRTTGKTEPAALDRT